MVSMMDKQQIPAGYKQTEVGVIPEDWGITTIGDFAPLQRGFDLPNRLRVNGLYPVVYSNGIVNFHNQFQVKGPGVVTGRSGTIGKVHYVETDYWPHNTALWVKKFNNAYPKYVYYLYLKIGLDRFASGSGVPTLNRNDAHSFKIGVPQSLDEQTAIANALSDVDALIAALEKLIDKKTAIKTATMQQLLTGKKRLPPFDKLDVGYKQTELGEIPKDWEATTLGEIAEVRMCKRILAEQTEKTGPIPFFKIGTFGRQPDAFIPMDLYNEFIEKYSFPEKGDILISAAGTLGKVVIYDGLPAYFQDSNIVWLEINKRKILNEFLYHCYKIIVWASSEGSTILRLYNGIIRATAIKLPPIEEQTAIANVLSDMDTELDALQQRLAKTQHIKQGMMQELLTGKTRLVTV